MHLPAFQSHPQEQLAAICGRNRKRAEAMAAKYGISQVFTDYREIIEHGSLDAVIMATPDDLHYPITMAALEVGLHVICEKPMASTAQQAKEIGEKAEAIGVKQLKRLFTLNEKANGFL